MNVYRLSPVEGKNNSQHWELSMIGAATCWVLAKDKEHARQQVWTATTIAREKTRRAQDTPIPPWLTGDLSECVEDSDKTVAPGVVLTSEGVLLPIDS